MALSQSSSSSASSFRQGNVINGKYEVIDLIGDGGMGFVIAAKHLELGEVVALKFLKPDALRNPEIVARFAREARASAKIKSEYVARVFDVGTLPDGAPFIVMEHLDGQDLSNVIEKRGALPTKLAVEYVMQVCEALAAAHSLGIIHRDVKPENLFLTHRSQGMDVVKVLDFGISKVALTGSAFETNLPLVRTMLPMGSPVYMSPEQIRASQDVDARSDIWSLGCVLYELLTGQTAFDAPSITQLSAIILEKHPASITELVPDAPPELEAVVERCLQKNPDDRFQNIADLAIALYPFGPRRARISAERCSFMLHGAGDSADFELVSVPPPPNADSGSADPLSTNPVIANLRRTNPRVSGARALARSQTGPERVETLEEEIPELGPELGLEQPTRPAKYIVYAAIGAVLCAMGYGAARSFTKPAASDPAHAAAVAGMRTPPAVAESPTNEQPAKPAPTLAEAATAAPSENPSGASANTESAVEKPSTAGKSRRAIAMPVRRAAPARPGPGTRHSEEIDVGF